MARFASEENAPGLPTQFSFAPPKKENILHYFFAASAMLN